MPHSGYKTQGGHILPDRWYRRERFAYRGLCAIWAKICWNSIEKYVDIRNLEAII
jgi:hypothetical protein